MSKKLLFATSLVVTFLVSACGPADLSEADTVARTFMQHLAASNYEEASHHVLPEDREAFLASTVALAKAPAIPASPAVDVQTEGGTGFFRVPAWHPSARFELELRDGRWWVRR